MVSILSKFLTIFILQTLQIVLPVAVLQTRPVSSAAAATAYLACQGTVIAQILVEAKDIQKRRENDDDDDQKNSTALKSNNTVSVNSKQSRYCIVSIWNLCQSYSILRKLYLQTINMADTALLHRITLIICWILQISPKVKLYPSLRIDMTSLRSYMLGMVETRALFLSRGKIFAHNYNRGHHLVCTFILCDMRQTLCKQ